jgi:three-Cys-motif partner protein
LNEIARAKWSKNRAVLFLDPFGLQVKWKTLEAVAATQAIDVWILFPLGSGVNRLLRRDGNIDPKHKKILDDLFGSEDWFHEFYKTDDEPDLFGHTQPTHTKCDLESVGKYFLKRLKTIFPHVALPLPLKNSKQNPIFLFCFAAANKGKGGSLAVKIANDIVLKELRRS